jgi:SOS-response transcriptional repressor LexA
MAINNLNNRIKQIRKALKLSQKDFANLLKISQGFLSEIEHGKKQPGMDLLQSLKRYDISIDWLLTGKGEMYDKPPIPEAIQLITIPILGKVPAGFPEHISEDIIEYISLPDVPAKSYGLIVKGDSMSPTIKDGDYVLFINNGDINNGDIVVVNNEWGESMIKRYRIREGETYLVSDNQEYHHIKPNEYYKIIGKVIGVWRKIKI